MTFRLTDDFAKTIANSLDEAYKTLKNLCVDPNLPDSGKEGISQAACVGTLATIIRENIGNDKVINKDTRKIAAIKSV